MQRMIALTALLILAVFAVHSTPLRDPGIPDNETAVYRIVQEDESWTVTERAAATNERGEPAYRFEYDAPNEHTKVLVYGAGMIPFYDQTITSNDSMKMDTTMRVELSGPHAYADVMVLALAELKYLLRGFRFGEDRTLNVAYLSTNEGDEGDTNFEISIRYQGTDVVKLETREVEAYKLELRMSASGILRVINALVPKTYFWYSVEAPHYLVAYEGSIGFAGSPKRSVQIIDYSGW